MIAGFIVGYLYVFDLLSFLQISDDSAKSLEESFLFSWWIDTETFIKNNEASKNIIAGSAGIGAGMTNYLRQQNDQNRPSDQNISNVNAKKNNANFKPFAGQGVKLGGEDAI